MGDIVDHGVGFSSTHVLLAQRILALLLYPNMVNTFAAYLRCEESATPLFGDAGRRQLPASGIRRVVDSPHQRYAESIFRKFKVKIEKVISVCVPKNSTFSQNLSPNLHNKVWRIWRMCVKNFGTEGECV